MDTTHRIEIAASRTKTVLLVLGSLAFVGAGVWFLTSPETFARGPFQSPAVVRGVGVVAVAFFGTVSAFALRRVLGRAPGLVLDSDGLTDRTSALGAGFIPWSDVAGIETGGMAGQQFVYVVLRDPDAFLRGVPSVRRALMKQNAALGRSPVTLTSVALDMGFDDMTALVRAYWEAHGPRRR